MSSFSVFRRELLRTQKSIPETLEDSVIRQSLFEVADFWGLKQALQSTLDSTTESVSNEILYQALVQGVVIRMRETGEKIGCECSTLKSTPSLSVAGSAMWCRMHPNYKPKTKSKKHK